MARHHYVPQFLLRQWGPNGRFVGYYFEVAASKVIENAKAIVTSACQIPNLNSYAGVDRQHRDFPEIRFFTPYVDTPGAKALQVMLTNGVRALTPEQRIAWARCLLSFAVRTPEALLHMGPSEAKKAFALVEASARGDLDAEARVSTIIRQNMPTLSRNFPLNAAMELCTDPNKLASLGRMKWWIRRWNYPAILIGDRPVLTFPRARYSCGIPLDDSRCLIALPIAPRAVFFASANPRDKNKVLKIAPGRIAHLVNEETIWRSTVVYAADKSLASFVFPRVEGKANGTWNPTNL